jgi:hypothetical protein
MLLIFVCFTENRTLDKKTQFLSKEAFAKASKVSEKNLFGWKIVKDIFDWGVYESGSTGAWDVGVLFSTSLSVKWP